MNDFAVYFSNLGPIAIILLSSGLEDSSGMWRRLVW
jgi:hypothetical protein